MTINTDGTIAIPYPPTTEKANGEKVRADHIEDDFDALIEGIDAQIDRYGKKAALANISMGNHRLINVATPVAGGDVANKNYVDGEIEDIPDATTSVKGLIEIASEEEAILGADATKAITPATLNKVVSDVIVDVNKQMPYKYLAGFDCADEGSGVIGTAVGYCRDETNAVDMSLTESISKAIGLTWDEGDNEGGMAPDVSVSPSSTYYIIAIATTPIDATNGTLTTAGIAANLSNFQAVSDGFCTVSVDNEEQNLSGLDFTACTSLGGVAEVFNNSALAGCNVEAVGNTLVFTSLTTGASSAINISSTVGGSGTDITLEDYLYIASEDTEIVNGTNFVKAKVDVGFDSNVSATNLLKTTGAPYLAGYRYYRKVGKFTTDDVSAIDVCDETENKLATSFNNITTYGLSILRKLLTANYGAGEDKSLLAAGWTADADGKVYVRFNTSGGALTVYVNSKEIGYRAGYDLDTSTTFFEVVKGDIITYSSNVAVCTFFPYRSL